MNDQVKWNKTATVGLVTMVVAVAAVVIIAVGAAQSRKNAPAAPNPGAATVDLPPAQLTAAESLVSPLLKTDLPAFDDVTPLDLPRAVRAVMNDLAFVYASDQNENGEYVLARPEFEKRFVEIFGFLPDSRAVEAVAEFDAENDVYVFSFDGYHEDYTVTVVSTGTLGDTVYVTAQAARYVEPVSQPAAESEPDEISSEPDEVSEDENPDGTVTEIEDEDVTSVEDESETESESEIESVIESETVSAPEPVLETVKTAVFTVIYENGAYKIAAMRYTD